MGTLVNDKDNIVWAHVSWSLWMESSYDLSEHLHKVYK